jgi:hypothetical protein
MGLETTKTQRHKEKFLSLCLCGFLFFFNQTIFFGPFGPSSIGAGSPGAGGSSIGAGRSLSGGTGIGSLSGNPLSSGIGIGSLSGCFSGLCFDIFFLSSF